MTLSSEERRIIHRPTSAEQAVRELVAAGFKPRSPGSVNNIRTFHEIQEDKDRRRLAKLLRRLADGEKYRVGKQSRPLLFALERNLVKRLGKTTYRITLGGLAWLEEHLGPDWEEIGE